MRLMIAMFSLMIVSILLFLLWATVLIVAAVNFDRHCGGFLKRAADSNTVELASENLRVAIEYARASGRTEGFTSVIYRTPDEDIGFWFRNLTSSLAELDSLPPDVTPLEKTNVLMKLRETLLDQGQSTCVTAPPGISRFPHNGIYALWGVTTLLLSAVLVCVTWALGE